MRTFTVSKPLTPSVGRDVGRELRAFHRRLEVPPEDVPNAEHALVRRPFLELLGDGSERLLIQRDDSSLICLRELKPNSPSFGVNVLPFEAGEPSAPSRGLKSDDDELL
jgi:hypothetical protein